MRLIIKTNDSVQEVLMYIDMIMYINSMRGMSVNVLVSGPHLAFSTTWLRLRGIHV